MTISFIVAMDERRGIGMDNKLPWHLPEDLAFFKRVTLGHTILMGRKTYESIGRPLPKRRNVILTRDRSYEVPGCDIVHSVEETLERYGSNASADELFVIGGAEVFRLFLPYADRLYVTEIARRFEVDTFFPDIEAGQWQEASREIGVKNEKNPYDYSFVLYNRVK